MARKANATGHVITPEGKEIATTRGRWAQMPADWRAFAVYLPCPGCTAQVGEPVNHPAGQPHTPSR